LSLLERLPLFVLSTTLFLLFFVLKASALYVRRRLHNHDIPQLLGGDRPASGDRCTDALRRRRRVDLCICCANRCRHSLTRT
jgi:hypothetical protein